MLKNAMYYTITGSVIGTIAAALGANMMTSLVASLVGPPFVLLAFCAFRYNATGWRFQSC